MHTWSRIHAGGTISTAFQSSCNHVSTLKHVDTAVQTWCSIARVDMLLVCQVRLNSVCNGMKRHNPLPLVHANHPKAPTPLQDCHR